MGTDIRSLKDPRGNAFGEDLYAAAQKPEDKITPVGSHVPETRNDRAIVPEGELR